MMARFPNPPRNGEGDRRRRRGWRGCSGLSANPSTGLRPTAAAQPLPALGMPPACRPAYTPLPVPGRI